MVNGFNQSLTVGVLILLTVAHQSVGWSRHTWDVPPAMMVQLLRFNFAYEILFSQAACQTKLSLLWFTRRLMGRANTGRFYPHFVALIILMVIVALCQILFIIISFVLCRYVYQSS